MDLDLFLPHLSPENANNEDPNIHPYGPFKSYTWDDLDNAHYVVNLDKLWSVIRANMTHCFGNLHAHIVTSSSDCDGSYENDWIQVASDTRFNDSREYVNLDKDSDGFDWNNYQDCTNEAEFRYSVLDLDEWDTDPEGRFEQTDEDGFRFERNKPTDEGYSHREVLFCYEWDCDLDETRYRDHRAESMGY